MKITCRICKIQQGEFFTLDSVVPIYGQMEHKLLEIYNKCFQLNALQQDALPQVVCLTCLEKLKDFYEFRLKAEKTDEELRKRLQEESPTTQREKIKDEVLDSCYITGPAISEAKASSSPLAVKPEMEEEEEVITTEDEYDDDDEEDHYDSDAKTQQQQEDDEEEVEDTDILFELYNKNDSCMENYLKFDKQEDSEEIIEDYYSDHVEHDDDIDVEFRKTDIDLESNYAQQLNTPPPTSDDMDSVHMESCDIPAPTVEISRLPLPVQTAEVQTITLDPLVESRKWQCEDCGRKYLTEDKLNQHRKLHNQSEDCQCEICGSHLKTLYDYREHMKTHGTERKFSCEYCDKAFSTRANLKAHLYIHTNLRPFKCEICGKTFQQKSILKTHMTLHTGKPFECTLCHRRFSRTAHLNIHMRQHNNIRPYQCSECPSSYMQKSHLDRHISSSHLGVRFQCTICGKMYTKKPSLNTHMREAHCTTVSLYHCDICDLDFAKQKGLYYHMKSKHPDYKKNQI